MQTRLSRDDGLMEYLEHTGSALFAVPPGVRKGGFLGDTLFAR
jgi:deferrochelatase/peroxidase EfeB